MFQKVCVVVGGCMHEYLDGGRGGGVEEKQAGSRKAFWWDFARGKILITALIHYMEKTGLYFFKLNVNITKLLYALCIYAICM